MKKKCSQCQGTGMLTGREAYVIHADGSEEFTYTGDESCYQCNAEGYIDMSNIDKYNIQTLNHIEELLKGKEDKKSLEEEVRTDITSQMKRNVIKHFKDKISKIEIDNFWEEKLPKKESQ